MEGFAGDEDKLGEATKHADFSGLLPAEFYDGINSTTIDDGEIESLQACSDTLANEIKKFRKFLDDYEKNNSDVSYKPEEPMEVDPLEANGSALAVLYTFLSGMILPLEEFKSKIEAFFLLKNLNVDPMEAKETNTKKGGNGSSNYNGGSSSYFDPSLYANEYDFGDEEEEEVDGGIDGGEEEIDDFEVEEEGEPEESKEEPEEKEEGVEEEEETSEIVPAETEEDDSGKVNGSKIIDEVKDASGKTVAVSVISNGKKKWYQVVNGNVVVPKEAVTSFNLPQNVTVTVDGETKTINSGSYPVDQVIYNADGSVRSVRMICDDMKIWAHLDSNGNIIKCDYIRAIDGMAELTAASYDRVDMYGNNIGKFSTGKYSFSEVMYDSNGNIIAYKLTGDGVYEEWVYPNGDTTNGKFEIYDKVQTSETSSVATFNDNKGLYGLLGILFVALGATLVVRKKIKDKENATLGEGEEYTDDTYVEDSLPAGNYGIYDVKKNDEGTITEARISPNNSNEECWVEV